MIHSTLLVRLAVFSAALWTTARQADKFLALARTMIMDTNAPTAAASVGVASPPKIVPMIAKINTQGMARFLIEAIFCDHWARSSLGSAGATAGLARLRMRI